MFHKSFLIMNTMHRLLKITGAIGLSCVCLTAEADPKTMTLEEVKAFLEQKRKETNEKLESVRKKIKEKNWSGYSFSDYNELDDEFSKVCGEGGVLKVTYNLSGTPSGIETVGHIGFDLYNAIDPTDLRLEYMQKQCVALPSDLEKISKELTVESLEEGVETDKESNFVGGVSIRKITFDSILSSDFFDKELREKGNRLLSDPKALEEAIYTYAEDVAILRHLPVQHVSYEVSAPALGFSRDPNFGKSIMKENRWASTLGTLDHFIYQLSDKALERKQSLLKETLKGMLKFKNGKEKVILLLLLEEMTPSEYRLEWVDGRWAQFLHNVNRIEFNFSDKRDHRFLSHEIGHYLQFHLRLHQTFRDYQNAFAKKLLLLEAPFEDDDKVFSIPEVLRGLFKKFEKSGGDAPETLTKNDLFMYWQLASRWNDPAEISNILGVYFDQDTIYVCTLSDICEQKYVRYGHAYCGGVYSEYKEKQKEGYGSSDRNDFEKIIQKAAESKPDAEVLKFLCKLHGVSFNGIVNLFDAKNEKEANDLEASYNNFRPSEEQ